MSSLEYKPTEETQEYRKPEETKEGTLSPKEAMDESIVEYKTIFNENLTQAERDIIDGMEAHLPVEDQKENVVNIIGKLRELTTGSPLKKILTTTAAYAMYFGVGTADAKASTYGSPLENPLAKEISAEMPSMVVSENTFDMGTMAPLDTEPSDPEKLKVAPESFKVNMVENFDLGKAVHDQADQERIESELADQISHWPQEIQKGLADGTYVVKIAAGCSPEPIKVPIDIGNGKKVDNNYDLSVERMNFGEERVKEAAKKLGFELKTIKAPAFKDGVDPERPERYVEISVEAVGKGFSNKLIFDGIDGSIEKIYVDASESMKGKVTQLFEALEAAGLANDPIKIQFGSKYNELSNEFTAKGARDAEIYDRSVRTKMNFSSDEETFQNANLIFKKMPLVPQVPGEVAEKKVVMFITDEYLTVSSSDIAALEFQEKVRNAEAVFLMQNRDTQEVTKLTLDDIKKLYESKNNGGKPLTIDVNAKKIGDGGKVDIKV